MTIRTLGLALIVVGVGTSAVANDSPIERLIAARQLVTLRESWQQAVRKIEAKLGPATESGADSTTWVAAEGGDCAWLVLSRGRSGADRGVLFMISTPVRLDEKAPDQDERASCLKLAASAKTPKKR